MGVGGLRVGVGVGYKVTTMKVGVGLAVDVGRLVKVGKAVGKVTGVGVGWVGGVLVGIAAGGRLGATPGLGGSVAGVVMSAIGVGCGVWMSTGRSPSASTRAPISVSTTAPTATSGIKTDRHAEWGSWPLVCWESVEPLAISLLTLILVRLVGT